VEGDGLGDELITARGPKKHLVVIINEKDQTLPVKTEPDKNDSKREGGAPTTHAKDPPSPSRDHVVSDREG
jgi:hypothetical protein